MEFKLRVLRSPGRLPPDPAGLDHGDLAPGRLQQASGRQPEDAGPDHGDAGVQVALQGGILFRVRSGGKPDGWNADSDIDATCAVDLWRRGRARCGKFHATPRRAGASRACRGGRRPTSTHPEPGVNASLANHLLQRLIDLEPADRPVRYLVAFSGGLDSTVLLHALWKIGRAHV